MPTEHLRHVLHGFDARAHGPSAPGMKKILVTTQPGKK